MIVILIWLPWF